MTTSDSARSHHCKMLISPHTLLAEWMMRLVHRVSCHKCHNNGAWLELMSKPGNFCCFIVHHVWVLSDGFASKWTGPLHWIQKCGCPLFARLFPIWDRFISLHFCGWMHHWLTTPSCLFGFYHQCQETFVTPFENLFLDVWMRESQAMAEFAKQPMKKQAQGIAWRVWVQQWTTLWPSRAFRIIIWSNDAFSEWSSLFVNTWISLKHHVSILRLFCLWVNGKSTWVAFWLAFNLHQQSAPTKSNQEREKIK